MKKVNLLLALALLASACGSSSSDSDESGSVSETETTGASGSDGETTVSADGDSPTDCASGTINVSGSSTVEPISTRAAELYEDVCGDTTITVDGPGTGDGFKLFCAGETDIADASRAIKDKEATLCADGGIEYTEIKVAFDGIVVMTNPSNDLACVNFADLYALLGGESEGFETWQDAEAIAAELGSTTTYPEGDLSISAPGTESGTYDSFIEIVLEKTAEAQQGEEGAQFIRTDFAGNADDNVIVDGIAGNDTSLGWVGFAFADANRDVVKSLAVTKEVGGECIQPSIETIADGSYPVSRSLYIYVNNDKLESNPALAGFVDFYLNDAYTEAVTKAFGDSGYVELPEDQLTVSRSALG